MRILTPGSRLEKNSIYADAIKYWNASRFAPIFGIILFGIFLSIPMLVNGFPVIGHDTNIHLAWYTRFADQLWSGELYPRWLMALNAGFGDAVFYFYGPLPYFLTGILRPIFTDDPFGWYQMGVSSSIALIFSGLFAYLWLKEITNPNSAFVGACIYMLLPYHLGYDLYIRAAFGEYFAFIWMPLILFFVQGIIERKMYSVVGLAVSYAALVLTHLSTTLLFSAIPVLYAFFLSERDSRIRNFGSTVGALLLGLGLSAIYLVPAIGLQRFVSIDYVRNTWLYQQSYLFSIAEFVPSLILKVSILVLSTAILAAIGVIVTSKSRDEKIKKMMLFWVVVGVISFFLMTPLSKPVVDLIPVVQLIQFPSRFNTVFTVAVLALFAMGVYTLFKINDRWRYVYIAAMSIIIIGWVISTLGIGWQQTAADKEINNQIVSTGIVANEYWPKWVQVEAQEFIESSSAVDRVSVADGDAEVRVLDWKPREISLSVSSIRGAQLILSHFYFPGWKVCIQGGNCSDTRPITPEGYITFDVPRGTTEMSIRLFPGIEEIAGLWITVGAVALAIFLAFRKIPKISGIDR